MTNLLFYHSLYQRLPSTCSKLQNSNRRWRSWVPITDLKTLWYYGWWNNISELTMSDWSRDLLLTLPPWFPVWWGELCPESGLGTGELCLRHCTYLASFLLDTRYLISLLKNFSTVWVTNTNNRIIFLEKLYKPNTDNVEHNTMFKVSYSTGLPRKPVSREYQ